MSINYKGMTETARDVIPALAAMKYSDVKRIIESFWYHKIHLGNGFYTPGTYDMTQYLKHFPMPEDLTKKSVLEIGAADGFFSLEMARRGAKVTALDISNIQTKHMSFLCKLFNIKLKVVKGDVFQLADSSQFGSKRFDYVWATNFMQHVKPGHNVNDHTKNEFIEVIKTFAKPGCKIVIASDVSSDIDLLRQYFDLNIVTTYTQEGFKVRTQTNHKQQIVVALMQKGK